MTRASALGLSAILFGIGCAGARASLTLPDARYPVSISNGMLGPNREMLTPREMRVVGHFHDEREAWGTFYSLIPFTPHLDLSEAINAQVGAAHGQAIVALRTSTKQCALDYFYVLNILPIWPGCANVITDGDIVAYVAPTTSAPEPAGATAAALPSGGSAREHRDAAEPGPGVSAPSASRDAAKAGVAQAPRVVASPSGPTPGAAPESPPAAPTLRDRPPLAPALTTAAGLGPAEGKPSSPPAPERRKPSASAKPATADCTVPFTIDSVGHHVPKPECL